MNQTTLLRIAENLERLAGRLPSKIQKAVLSELTPLKELFLQQRPPRFLLIGSSTIPTPRILNALFSPDAHEQMNVAVMPVHRWVDWDISGHGTISVLDARDADASAAAQVEDDLKRQPPDIVFVFDDGEPKIEKASDHNSTELALRVQHDFGGSFGDAKVIGIAFGSDMRTAQFEEALKAQPALRGRLLKIIVFSERPRSAGCALSASSNCAVRMSDPNAMPMTLASPKLPPKSCCTRRANSVELWSDAFSIFGSPSSKTKTISGG